MDQTKFCHLEIRVSLG